MSDDINREFNRRLDVAYQEALAKREERRKAIEALLELHPEVKFVTDEILGQAFVAGFARSKGTGPGYREWQQEFYPEVK